MTIQTIAPEISIDDFLKVDLRVGKIIEANTIEGADKMLQLTVDFGEATTRNILAGIKEFYTPDDLVGVHAVFCVNLAPRKMRFGISEGMILAASLPDKSTGARILKVESAVPGMKIG